VTIGTAFGIVAEVAGAFPVSKGKNADAAQHSEHNRQNDGDEANRTPWPALSALRLQNGFRAIARRFRGIGRVIGIFVHDPSLVDCLPAARDANAKSARI
jgi:hypothetical protein